MRGAFVSALIELAASDQRVFLLTGDLGWSVLERFAKRFPKRFINVGVAEANMVGIATGLALEGYVPFAYSIATFASMRPFEQVRNGPVLHGLPVRIVGIGGGFAYGHAGPTHYAFEDLAIMRSQPGMTVIAPADPAQARAAVLASRDIAGPAYFRVGKGGNAEVPGLGGRFALDRPEVVREGVEVLLLATGAAVHQALGAAQMLAHEGRSAAVGVLAHLGFTGSPELAALLSRFRAVVTVEDAYTAGGLGALAAETAARAGMEVRIESVGLRGPFAGGCGSEDWLRKRHGLDAGAVAGAARRTLSPEK